MIVGQADLVLPERKLLVAPVGEQADVDMVLGEFHAL
jgi:hypothetical protein